MNQRLYDCGDTSVTKNKSREHNGGAAQIEKLMVREDFRVRGFDECHLNELRSPFGTRLSRHSKRLNARATVTTVHNKERKLVLEKALFPTKRKHTVGVESAESSGPRAGHGHQPSTVLLPVPS